ncbi:Uroporphyrinogen III synthase HEM4 [Methanothermus fervidus DSM 2088]|uniref:Uroporphyrinogen III synthase HEM4 n=1 Tax=Methanothermus fervidus (strain ATCC 43054 / DSM 2088 / JCM 10308 / V24 S) TaxID=523846 RepID=E3GX89_METFV|nr:uroporphyrinogen-III synthase [Methanothermus fervidus]ADP78084.1 Uroporphyrinogen III synthase HEM4 [Methanothermus fervidus DSM 2088]
MEMKNKIIAVTRPKDRAQEAVDIIEKHGGKALVVPTLELKKLCTESLMKICKIADKLDWVIFTSPFAVDALLECCPQFPKKLNKNAKIAVIGPKTKKTVIEKGLKVDVEPPEYVTESLIETLKNYDMKDKNVAIPRTKAARKTLIKSLEEMGANVYVAEAYKSTLPKDVSKIKKLINKIINNEIDAITFTSPLTVKNLFKVAGNKKDEVIKVLSSKKVLAAAIGPITANTLFEYAIVPIIPHKYTVREMILEIFREFRRMED